MPDHRGSLTMAIHGHRKHSIDNCGYIFNQNCMLAPKINILDVNPFHSQRIGLKNCNSEYSVLPGNIFCQGKSDGIDGTSDEHFEVRCRRGSEVYENERRLNEYRRKILKELSTFMETRCEPQERGDNYAGFDGRFLHKNLIAERSGAVNEEKRLLSDSLYRDPNNNEEFFIRGNGVSSMEKLETKSGVVNICPQGITTTPMSPFSLLTMNEARKKTWALGYEAMDVDRRSNREVMGLIPQNDLLMSIQESGHSTVMDAGGDSFLPQHL